MARFPFPNFDRLIAQAQRDARDYLLDSDWVTAISHLRAQASWDGTTPGSDRVTAIYNPPPGWVIVESRTITHSSSNGGGSVSVLAGGLNLVIETEIGEAYQMAIDAAASQNDAAVMARLEEKRSQHLLELRRWRTNMNTLQAEAHARAHGSTIDRKRGWHEITVDARILRIGSSALELMTLLESEYGIDIPGV